CASSTVLLMSRRRSPSLGSIRRNPNRARPSGGRVSWLAAFLLVLAAQSIFAAPARAAAPATSAAAVDCVSSVGPGIAPPPSVPSGIPGFHAAWYGQSGYPTLCPGERSTATVAYYNSGSRGWV